MTNNNNNRDCPSCQSCEAKKLGNKNGFQISVCRHCQTLYTARLPNLDEAENYDNYYSEENLQVPEFIHRRLNEIFVDFSRYRQTNRWLDVGFGAGSILKIAAELDWEVFGVEVSKPAIEQARKRNFDVFHGDLIEANYPDNYFDVITASEIIEHLPEPQKLLNEIERILRPDGLFWATTPSAKGISYRLLGLDWTIIVPPEHIQIFSKKGITGMLKKAGFSHINLRTHGTNPLEIINHFRQPNKERGDFSRVESGYDLNENLEKGPVRKKIKSLLNQTLNLAQIGDSLKIYAQK